MKDYNNYTSYNNGFDDCFSGMKPDLINKKIMKKFTSMTHLGGATKAPQNTEVHWSDSLSYFYTEYVEQNILLIILLFIFVLFLIYKYKMKETFGESLNDDTDYIREQDKIYFKPTFNPYYSVDEQTSYVNYLPDSAIPLEVTDKNGEEKLETYNEYYKPKPKKNLYRMPYNVNSQQTDYTGLYNTYEGTQDPVLPNAIGYPADINTVTDDAMEYTTSRNRKNLDLLAEIIF